MHCGDCRNFETFLSPLLLSAVSILFVIVRLELSESLTFKGVAPLTKI